MRPLALHNETPPLALSWRPTEGRIRTLGRPLDSETYRNSIATDAIFAMVAAPHCTGCTGDPIPAAWCFCTSSRRCSKEARAFVQRHGDLLRALPGWTPRLLFRRQSAGGMASFESAVRDELAPQLSPHTVEELKWAERNAYVFYGAWFSLRDVWRPIPK